MKATVIGNCLVIVAICLGIAAPLAVWRNAQAEAQAKDNLLRNQKEAIKEFSAANAIRKKETVARSADALTDEQLNELLRLRAEVSALRRETNNLGRLGVETKLTPEEQAERAQEFSAELLDAARKILAALPDAQERFAAEHGGEAAKYFSDLRKYFPAIDGHRMPGLYSFAFAREEGPKPGDSLILESGTHDSTNSQKARIYAFSDGRVLELDAPASQDADNFFESWEKQQLNSSRSPGQ